MERYRYILQPYSGMNSRFRCPSCQKAKKTFTRYIDTEIGEYLPIQYGRCERENNCNYFLNPYSDGYNQEQFLSDKLKTRKFVKRVVKLPEKGCDYIESDHLVKSLEYYSHNHFIEFLTSHFGTKISQSLISKYFIGTSSHWNGATIFWQIDIEGKIRTGKIMQYNASTGRRIKEPYNHIQWVHKAIKLEVFSLKQCLFGEHLLKNDLFKPVAIVESEKTALIASVYFPKFIWLATGSLTNLSEEKCQVLKGRNVLLFPDLNAYEKWNAKTEKLSHITKFKISDFLEIKSTIEEKKLGLDLADYLLRFDYKEFIPTQEL